MEQKIKKSDKIERKVRDQALTKMPSITDVWVEVRVNKALVKSIKDNDIPHIWGVVLAILAFVLGMGFAVTMLVLKICGVF